MIVHSSIVNPVAIVRASILFHRRSVLAQWSSPVLLSVRRSQLRTQTGLLATSPDESIESPDSSPSAKRFPKLGLKLPRAVYSLSSLSASVIIFSIPTALSSEISKNMSEEEIDAHDRVEGYIPPPEFEEDGKESLFDLASSDSHEFWLIQWPANQPPDFDGQEVSLKLHHDGKLGSFEGSSGKVYDVVSFGAQEPDATVFLSSSRESKMAGKISRRVSLVHYPDPKELEKANSSNMKQMHKKSSGFSFTTSSHQLTTPTQSSGKRRSDSVSRQTTSTHSSKQKSSLSEIGEPSNPADSVDQSSKKSSKKRRPSEPTRSIGQSTQSSQRGSSAITMSGSSE